MKKSLLGIAAPLAAAVTAVALPLPSYADLAFNVGVVSEYRYRGISQTRKKPALQGGVDWSHASGLYLGAWGSTIKWVEDLGGDAKVEIDVYGGYKGTIVEGVGYDVGVLTYQYPSNKLKAITGASANTTEVYGALTYGPATVKYSHAVSDTFAAVDSKNSYYLDLSASFDVGGGVIVAPHVGHQRYKGPLSGAASYWDYSLTASKDFNGLVPSVAVVGNSRIDDASGYYMAKGKDLSKTTVVLGVKYNF